MMASEIVVARTVTTGRDPSRTAGLSAPGTPYNSPARMPLERGSHLGPYEILGPLGAGGMGEVYKARDPRLNRTIAIKVLPPHIAERADLRERSEREARAIAAVNHPHICLVHDVGRHAAGTGPAIEFLVMEYLEGETLADRIAKGPLPFDLLVTYAAQIADALDKAHYG